MRCMLLAGIGIITAAALGCSGQTDGFTPLFNGQDLQGWTEIGSSSAWSVEAGVLRCNGQHEDYAWLCTDRKYCDFVLSLDWRLGPNVNSGVFCRVPQHEGRASMLGFEIQVADNATAKQPDERCGSIFKRATSDPDASFPLEQWNRYEITCRGPQVTVVCNGRQVLDVDTRTIESMKDVPVCGYIGLQNHGDPVEFRNVRIKELVTATEP
ncbi:MAG: DUF1080 domain-containing protein [Phycisphaerae bacterium]|nr:DUF1080 domain-containing protein [Phycisphaerae bacterium]